MSNLQSLAVEHKRMNFSARTKDDGFKRCKGLCEHCGMKLQRGRIQYDHILADNLGGKPELANLQVLCVPCHKIKTGVDRKLISRADRLARKSISATAPKAKIQSAGFPKSEKTPLSKLPLLPPRQLYRDN